MTLVYAQNMVYSHSDYLNNRCLLSIQFCNSLELVRFGIFFKPKNTKMVFTKYLAQKDNRQSMVAWLQLGKLVNIKKS